MSEQTTFKVGDWIMPAHDMYDSPWKGTIVPVKITSIEDGRYILFDGSYSLRQNGRFEAHECRLATPDEISMKDASGLLWKTYLLAKNKVDNTKREADEAFRAMIKAENDYEALTGAKP